MTSSAYFLSFYFAVAIHIYSFSLSLSPSFSLSLSPSPSLSLSFYLSIDLRYLELLCAFGSLQANNDMTNRLAVTYVRKNINE